jgi:hypothetical protein
VTSKDMLTSCTSSAVGNQMVNPVTWPTYPQACRPRIGFA